MLEDVNEQLTKRFINLHLQIWRHCRHVFTRPDFCTNVLYNGRPVKPFLVKSGDSIIRPGEVLSPE